MERVMRWKSGGRFYIQNAIDSIAFVIREKTAQVDYRDSNRVFMPIVRSCSQEYEY